VSVHNYFFYLKKDMPWKTKEVPYAIQTTGTDGSGKKGQEVDVAEEASDESKSDSASKGA